MLLLLLGVAGVEPPVEAGDPPPGRALLVMGPAVGGVYDAGSPPMVFFEYRRATGRYRPRPWVGFDATRRDLFAGFGVFLDLPIGRRWVFTPSIGPGFYAENDGLGLGSPLEFRSTAEVTIHLKRVRIGASFEHLSNVDTGSHNPGTEIVKLVWVIPLPWRRADSPR